VRTVEPVSRQRVLALVYGGCTVASAVVGLAWWAYYGDAVLGGSFLVMAVLLLAAYRLLTQPQRRRVQRAAERAAMGSDPAGAQRPTELTEPRAQPAMDDGLPHQTGQITVERPGGYAVAILRRYRIHIDGVRAGAVRRGQSVSFTVPPGPHSVAARIDWSGSREVIVHVPPGGHIKLDVEPAGDSFAGLFSADKMLTLTVRP
jgi:hypothetical protein